MLGKVWNDKRQGWDWVDLSYVLGKTDIPNPLNGQPVSEDEDDDSPSTEQTDAE
jgi:hypothetical protein